MFAQTQTRRSWLVGIAAAILLSAGSLALAQQSTYEGDIVAVDTTAHTFTVKSSKPGEVAEMAFHVGVGSQIAIGGEPRLLGELVKGDHVVVTYGTASGKHTVHRAERVKTASKELTFTGSVIAVDEQARTFTVKNTTAGKVAEMRFHVSPSARLYIGGEEVLLQQLRKGETVTVAYESIGSAHHVKHVKKSA